MAILGRTVRSKSRSRVIEHQLSVWKVRGMGHFGPSRFSRVSTLVSPKKRRSRRPSMAPPLGASGGGGVRTEPTVLHHEQRGKDVSLSPGRPTNRFVFRFQHSIWSEL